MVPTADYLHLLTLRSTREDRSGLYCDAGKGGAIQPGSDPLVISHAMQKEREREFLNTYEIEPRSCTSERHLRQLRASF